MHGWIERSLDYIIWPFFTGVSFWTFPSSKISCRKYGRSVGAKLVIQIMFFLIKNKNKYSPRCFKSGELLLEMLAITFAS
jgi:hypothetical protein